MVFVLDKKKRPLMPCSEKRARLLLTRGRAVVHRMQPFVIRLKDRLVEESQVQLVAIKIDPGSKVTGVALAREILAGEGVTHHALHLSQVEHRGDGVSSRMGKRSRYRRRRRNANLRYRPARFNNRKQQKGWLSPSLRSRVGNILNWVNRYRRWAPITKVYLEFAKFDIQKLDNPEISSVEYQQGELYGYEIKQYLLEKWKRKCAYCGTTDRPLQIEHVIPKSRGGSNRVSNLTIACAACNQAKGNQAIREFLSDRPGKLKAILAQAKQPVKDAAIINATRWAIFNGLKRTELPLVVGTGGRTSWNRSRLRLPKTHSLDALCVGKVARVTGCGLPVLHIRARGRGLYCRTNVDASGFPRGYRMRQKSCRGFQTGDLVKADIPRGKNVGVHVGRVAIRKSGFFRVGRADGINWHYCRIIQKVDGYEYDFGGE